MNKTLGFIAVAIILVGVGVYFSSSNSAQSEGVLTFQETSYDFGMVPMNNGNVTHEFIVENTSQSLVTISEISTSCMCTTAFLTHENHEIGPFGMSGHDLKKSANTTIQPGERVIVRAVFDPAAHGPSGVGHIERTIYIKTNSSAQPMAQLSFVANVVR